MLSDLGRRINSALSGVTADASDEAIAQSLKEICTALLESDVNFRLVAQLRDRVKAQLAKEKTTNKKRLVQKLVFDELVALVDCKATPYKPKKKVPNVVMMVGLQGAGKTTTCAKLALFYQKRGFKVGMVCADTFRAGAFDQLKQNATRAQIPFYGLYVETDPVKVAKAGVEKFKKEKFDLIIVDTSGRHRQEQDLFEEMVDIGEAVNPNQTIMVLDASIGQAAELQSRAFKEAAGFGSIILTKMDGHAKGGGALSAVALSNTPIAFIGTGEHVGDLEPFLPRSFVLQLLGIGDIQGLMEHVQLLDLDQKETIEHFKEGRFTLRDFQSQMNNMLKMGPLLKIALMIPGMSQMMQGVSEEDALGKLRKMVYVLDLMTKQELDNDGSLFAEEPLRIVRVARGLGTSVADVELVLMQARMMGRLAKNMGPGMGQGMPQGVGRGRGAPRMPGMGGMPAIPGGLDKMAEMMKGMPGMNEMMRLMGGGAGGMPDMGEMMRNMQRNPQMMAGMQDMMRKFGMG